MGGGQGPVVDDKYYLERHGHLTEVTYEVWLLIWYLGIISFCGFCLAILCFLFAIAAHFSQWGWYLNGYDYSLIMPVIVLFDFIYILAGSCFRGFNSM